MDLSGRGCPACLVTTDFLGQFAKKPEWGQVIAPAYSYRD